MSYPVFGAFPRADASYARHNEPASSFLNRVSGEYWDSVRDLINTWVEHYPDDARADLVGRLRSPDNRHFGGAFWELYLHETYIGSGFDVQVHPAVSGPRPPDFLVTRGSEGYYVEATAMFGSPNVGEQARLRQVFDAINKVETPDFFLSLDIRAIGQSAPPTKQLRSSLESWLAGLDPDDTPSFGRIDQAGPELLWQEAGWEIHFRPFPVRADARGRGHLPMGMWGQSNTRPVGNSESILDTLKEKGSAYGALDRPLLIAINASTGFNRDFETMNALYGSAQVRFNSEHPEYLEDTRAPDGYWGRPDSWTHRHVSGVLLAPNISAFNVSTMSPTVWLHPCPAAPIDPLNSWRTAVLEGNQVEQKDSTISPREMFGLPLAWPPGEPFPRR